MRDKQIYVSSKLKHRDKWISSGIVTVSSWIYGEELPPEECSAMWDRYREEVLRSDGFVLYAEPGERLKGCLVELGLAFALRIPILIVWQGRLSELAEMIGTMAYHETVTIVSSIEEAADHLENAVS